MDIHCCTLSPVNSVKIGGVLCKKSKNEGEDGGGRRGGEGEGEEEVGKSPEIKNGAIRLNITLFYGYKTITSITK